MNVECLLPGALAAREMIYSNAEKCFAGKRRHVGLNRHASQINRGPT